MKDFEFQSDLVSLLCTNWYSLGHFTYYTFGTSFTLIVQEYCKVERASCIVKSQHAITLDTVILQNSFVHVLHSIEVL